MSSLPFEQAEGLRIGTVEFVSPDQVKVSVDTDAPEAVALNAGTPRLFPRVNGYVLIPVDSHLLVGQIEWITVERSTFPKRKGMQDFGLIDLPYPIRHLSLTPLGTLRPNSARTAGHKFERGSGALPSIGAAVLIPTDRQLRSIVESGENRRVAIGTSPLAADATVAVDPDRIFGRHLAVLGNTGSGKSCSVAGLIRWSIQSARDAGGANARFIILDPNGEYAKAFKDQDEGVRTKVFKVSPTEDNVFESLLRVPIWFWNSAEWCSFTQATAKTQRPTLVQALRSVRDGIGAEQPAIDQICRRFFRTALASVRADFNSGSPWGQYPKPMAFFQKLETLQESARQLMTNESVAGRPEVQALIDTLDSIQTPRRVKHPKWEYTIGSVKKIALAFQSVVDVFGGLNDDSDAISADDPIKFASSDLVRAVETTAEMFRVAEHCETLIMRIKGLLSDTRMRPLVSDQEDESLESWLSDYVANDGSKDATISILDLSLVPMEVSHLLTAVVARVVFESLQRYRKVHGVTLPTVLVTEEAHTFVRRYKDGLENSDASTVCCQTFERIAREGRKFGLGMILSSQRPSELSPTVLSQCNSFLLHRISNDRDQEMVAKLVPDNMRGLLRELPSLPSRNAILLGWASELPVLVTMNELKKEHRPESDDPDFWDVWTGKNSEGEAVDRPIGWESVVHDWVGSDASAENAVPENSENTGAPPESTSQD